MRRGVMAYRRNCPLESTPCKSVTVSEYLTAGLNQSIYLKYIIASFGLSFIGGTYVKVMWS